MTKITGTIQEAKVATGLGRSTIYERISDGTLKTVKVGRRTLIKWDSLLGMLQAA